jgi:hypothetical protein
MSKKTIKPAHEAELASNFVKTTHNDYQEKMMCHARSAIVWGLTGMALVTLAAHFADKARREYHSHRQWKALDEKLDQALRDSGE